jgi:hypothetical protein
MSNSNATSNTNAGEMSAGDMTGVGGSMTMGEMPSGQTMGASIATMAEMDIAEMPSGDMTGVGDSMTMGEMPSGQTMGASIATMAEMPLGSMVGAESITGGMPSGQMIEVGTATMAGMAITEMPFGYMLNAERPGSLKAGELPAMEITGEWRLTLSSVSLKSGT